MRVAPYATFGTPELADGVLDALEGKTAALWRTTGRSRSARTSTARSAATELLEWAANVYWHAAQIGEPRALDEDELDAVVARGRRARIRARREAS